VGAGAVAAARRKRDVTPWNDVVLCSPLLGGAEIFALERLVALGSSGLLRCNRSLHELIVADARYRAIPVEVVTSLEALALKVDVRNMRRSAAELSTSLRRGGVLLGNLRAASVQLASPWAHRNTVFIHDNTRDLNAKARWLVVLAALRSRRLMFPCRNSDAQLPLRRLLAHKLGVEYFAECRVAAGVKVPRSGTLRIANVGRIGPDKNQQLAAGIAAALARHFERVELTLLGTVLDAGYLQGILDRTGPGNVSVSTRQVHRSQIPEALRQHDLVLHTSLIESLPLVMFEAGAADVPFFAVDAGGIAELLPPHRLIEPESDAAAAKIIAQLSEAPGAARRIAAPSLHAAGDA
jgi:glycosyltransferase involved in cell wall biosynthesis